VKISSFLPAGRAARVIPPRSFCAPKHALRARLFCVQISFPADVVVERGSVYGDSGLSEPRLLETGFRAFLVRLGFILCCWQTKLSMAGLEIRSF
jgi:hypothetical protein